MRPGAYIGRTLSYSYSLCIQLDSPIRHAEMLAFGKAGRRGFVGAVLRSGGMGMGRRGKGEGGERGR